MQLYGKNKPVTVSNFIQNVNKNIYKNKRFYKIINFPQVKVIHSGFSLKTIITKKKIKI